MTHGLLLQLIVILAAARAVAWIARRLGQAEVVGEMLAGILLGPSLLGYVAPNAFDHVFAAETRPVFAGIAQLGVVLLMFQLGLELKLSMVAAAKRTVVLVSVLGIVVPFAIGSVTSFYFYASIEEPKPPLASFVLIFAVAMSITALPVLGRIFSETGLAGRREGAVALAAAAINDVIGWLLLGAISLLVAGEFSLGWVGVRVAGIGALCAVTYYFVRPQANRFFDAHFARHDRLEHTGIALALVLLFGFAFATTALGVHALIGGFLFGVALHQHRGFAAEWNGRIAPLVNALLLPIFFTHTGLRTDAGSLATGAEVVQCLLICGVAFLGKYGGAYLGARIAGEPPRTARVLAISMNTRGLMELIVLNIGYDLGILSRELFTQLVYMAVITTLIATPLIRRYVRTEPVR